MTRPEQHHSPLHVTLKARAGKRIAVGRTSMMPDHQRQAGCLPGSDVQKKAGFF